MVTSQNIIEMNLAGIAFKFINCGLKCFNFLDYDYSKSVSPG